MIYGQPITFGGASGEIDITDNGTFDVKKYATANVNVQSAPVLLWTNASPTSAFAAQTVNVNGSEYIYYLIEVRFSTSDATTGVALIPVETSAMTVASVYSGVAPAATRGILSTTSSSITFGNGAYGSTANNYAIPTRIWGVKFTL